MNVLVAYASKHGSTAGIAEAIASELRAQGIDATSSDVSAIRNLQEFDALILGSAVYMGRWRGEAREFADRYQGELRQRPVWLFSSGPLGEDKSDTGLDPNALEDLIQRTGARSHTEFSGALDPEQLSLPERLVVKMVHAPTGDYRDWDSIRSWTDHIVEALRAEEESESTPSG